MMKLFTLAAVCAYASAAVIELDPRVEEHQETILNNLNDCDFDLIRESDMVLCRMCHDECFACLSPSPLLPET